MTDVVQNQNPETLLDPNLSPEVKDAAANIMNELDAVNPQPDVIQSFVNGLNGKVDRIIDSRGKPKPQVVPSAPDVDTARLIDLFKSGLNGNRQASTPAAPTDNVTQAFLDGLNGIRRNTDTATTTADDTKAIVENEHDKATTAETATVEPASNLVERIDVDETSKKEIADFKKSDIIEAYTLYGAYTEKNDPYSTKRNTSAENYYQQIRNRNRNIEIKTISKNSGFSESDVDRIFAHLFELDHLFRDGSIHRFYPDYYIQQSWMRLREGKKIQPHDIILLQHELAEATIMGTSRTVVYEDVHEEISKQYNYAAALREYLKTHDA